MFEILIRRVVGGHFRTLKFLKDRFALDEKETLYSEVNSVSFYRVRFSQLGIPISTRWIAEIESPRLTLSTFWFTHSYFDCEPWFFILAAMRRFVAPAIAAEALREIQNPLGRFRLGPLTLTREGIHIRRYLIPFFLRWEDYAGCKIGGVHQTLRESPSILWPEAVGKDPMLIMKALPNDRLSPSFGIGAKENTMPIVADVLLICYRAIILGDQSPEAPDEWLTQLMSDDKRRSDSGMKIS